MEGSRKAATAFVLALLSTSLAPAPSGALTETEALRVFLEQSPRSRQVPVVLESVEAEMRVETRVADPEIAYQVEDAAGVRDEFLTLRQELPISGRRGLLGERAELASAAAGFAAKDALQADAYDLKRSFHEVVYREQVLERLRHGAGLLERAVEILAGREREGEASGYDVLRAEQELAELRWTLAEAETALAATRSRFGAFYDPDLGLDSARLEGELAPSGRVPEMEAAIERALAQRLDLRALNAQRERLALEHRAARRRRFPDPVVTAGWKRSETLGLSETGYVAGLAVPLPIFGRTRLDTRRAAFEQERVGLEAEILARRIRAEVRAAVVREQIARRAAEEYGGNAERRGLELHRIARLKYDEGESGILELLDAHRTSLSMQLRALAARYEAKCAEIDRNRVIGNEVKP